MDHPKLFSKKKRVGSAVPWARYQAIVRKTSSSTFWCVLLLVQVHMRLASGDVIWEMTYHLTLQRVCSWCHELDLGDEHQHSQPSLIVLPHWKLCSWAIKHVSGRACPKLAHWAAASWVLCCCYLSTGYKDCFPHSRVLLKSIFCSLLLNEVYEQYWWIH